MPAEYRLVAFFAGLTLLAVSLSDDAFWTWPLAGLSGVVLGAAVFGGRS